MPPELIAVNQTDTNNFPGHHGLKMKETLKRAWTEGLV